MGVFFLLCVEPKGLTIKGLPMSCHWHSLLITGHDDGIKLVGVRVSESLVILCRRK